MGGGKRGCRERAMKWKAQADETNLILWHSHASNQSSNQVLSSFEQNWLKFLLL